MPKLFGTDGVRGIANKDLTAELATKLGQAGAAFLSGQAKKIVVGRDTRISGNLLESALSAGICAAGLDVYQLGVMPTPAVAYLTRKLGADGGVVISASHNPAEYNGIKFFNANGIKLTQAEEVEIEKLMDGLSADKPAVTDIGRIVDASQEVSHYISHIKNTISGDLNGLKVALDCANGAVYNIAPKVLSEMGAEVTAFNTSPNGLNINKSCGSTHLGSLQKIVKDGRFDIGLAFDGDADRVLAVDESGNLVDGDFIMAVCAAHLNDLETLRPKVLVTTVMTNIGFDRSMAALGIKVIKTSVGDRHVLQEMLDDEVMIGGEQSGHIIFLNHNSTGDGIITALQLLTVMRDKNQPLSRLTGVMTRFPQVLKNIRVKEEKNNLLEVEPIKLTINRCQDELKGAGRILVRPSGTEPLVRVMVEAATIEKANRLADKICDVIEDYLAADRTGARVPSEK